MKKIISFGMLLFLITAIAISQDKLSTTKLEIKGISCEHCVKEVKSALANVKGVSSVEFEKKDFKENFGIVKVSYNPEQASVDKIADAINEAGFETNLQKKKEDVKVEGNVVKINVKGIECGGCVKSVESSLKKVNGVKSVEFESKDYKKKFGVVKVVYDPEKAKVSDLEDAIVKAGFTANDKKPEKTHKEMEH